MKKHLKSAVVAKRSKKELRAAKKYIAECLSSSSSESSSSDGYSSNEEWDEAVIDKGFVDVKHRLKEINLMNQIINNNNKNQIDLKKMM